MGRRWCKRQLGARLGLAPKATQILDWHHAIEHGSDCCKALYGESANDCFDLWKATVERLLLEDVGLLLTQLRECLPLAVGFAAKTALENLIGYYETNEARMRHGDFLRDGFPLCQGCCRLGVGAKTTIGGYEQARS